MVFRCIKCKKSAETYKTLTACRKHFQTRHSDVEGLWPCDECDEKFVKKSSVGYHWKLEHQNKNSETVRDV
jgi:hypothetical protein